MTVNLMNRNCSEEEVGGWGGAQLWTGGSATLSAGLKMGDVDQ